MNTLQRLKHAFNLAFTAFKSAFNIEKMLRMPSYIYTHTGKKFDYLNVTADMICIEDIAHALAHTNRYGGHTIGAYNVAQHSLHCCSLVGDEFKLEALLHDAAEAYLGDVPTPLKQLLPDFQAIERNVEKVIAMKFGVPYPMSPEVKKADRQMLYEEMANVFPDCHPIRDEIDCAINPRLYFIEIWGARTCEERFLKEFHALKGK